jgi:hypothetical protein
MCEFWIYGCGHAIRTPCPRPKPTTTITTTSTAGGSTGSNISTSTHSSPRRGSSNTTTTTTSTDLPFISKFCNGFPTIPKETSAPCYNCILADAKLKVHLEKAEVDAKKEELRRGSMARTIARGPDGRYVDEFGNKIIAEEEYEQEYLYGGRQGRDRRATTTTTATFTGGRGNGNGRFAGNGYTRGDQVVVNTGQDRPNSAGGGGTFNTGNGGFRGARLPNGYGYSNNNNNNGNSRNFQDEQGQQRSRDILSSNGFGPPRRNTYSSQNGGYQNGNTNSYGQQHVQNDFGGASWGLNGDGDGGLGHGLDGSMYHQVGNGNGNGNGRRL